MASAPGALRSPPISASDPGAEGYAGGLILGGLKTRVSVCLGDGGVARGDRIEEALCVASRGSLQRKKQTCYLGQKKKERAKQEGTYVGRKTYAMMVGREHGFFTTFFFCFFFGGLEIPEDPTLEDPVVARFRGGPCGPTARGGTSST